MKKISIWASHHRWASRLLIVGLYMLLNVVGFVAGDIIFSNGIIISGWIIYGIALVFLAAVILYPSRKEKTSYNNFYRYQKLTDLCLITTTFLLVVSYGNHNNTTQPVNNSPFYTTLSFASTSFPATDKSENPAVKKKKDRKTLRQKLRANIHLLRQEYRSASSGEKAALIVVSVLVALLLFFLVASLSCNLSCSGSGGAATVVLIFGTGLIIFLLVRVIKRINRGKPIPPTSPPANGL